MSANCDNFWTDSGTSHFPGRSPREKLSSEGGPMYHQMTMERLEAVYGADVYDSSGDTIGTVEHLYVDQQTGQPEWLALGTGFLGKKRVLVPLAGADIGENGV